jgi:hypothetical protein
MSSLLFQYLNNTGKVALVELDQSAPPQPHAPFLNKIYGNHFHEFIDKNVEAARDGDFLSSIDVMLTMSHFLKEGIPIPESLSIYIADILQNAAVTVGQTEGKSEKRNAAVTKALGLVKSKSAKIPEQEIKRQMVHSYIWWRKKLFSETIYAAAVNAERTFRGTKRLSQDACEKIYIQLEKAQTAENRTSAPSLNHFWSIKINPADYKYIVFKNDDFLKAVVTHTEPTNKDEIFKALDL